MLKTKKIARVLCVVLCLVLFLCACDKTPDPTTAGPTQPKEAIHTITVTTNGCAIPRNVTVYVYDSVEKDELIDFGSLDANGQFTFTGVSSDKYIAVLQGVPAEGYGLQEYYPLTSTKTEIKLNGSIVTGKDPLEQGKTYRLGNSMRDFTVTTSDGRELTLSEILEEKKAVMLSFWVDDSNLCKDEFPLIQQAYELFQEDIEVIAMNPFGQDNDSIEAYRNELGLTFPMAAVDSAWIQAIGISGYPTTLIIDRYGMICLKETSTGDITEGVFEGAFSHFASDDYVQKTCNTIFELNNYEFPLGSKNNPYETHGEAGEFEVTIAPGEEVYSLIYKANNVTIRIENPNVYLVYGNERIDPNAEGIVEVVVSSPDSMTGASLIIGNTGDEEITVKAAVIPEDNTPQGTADKPFPMEMGQLSVSIAAGNELGVFYTVTAAEAGILKVVVTGVTEGVGFDVQLYNLTTMAQRNLQEEELVDENGNAYVTVAVNAGDVIRVGFMTLMDNATSKYPAADIQATVSEEEDPGTTDVTYSITVKDDEGNPMPGVSASLTVDGVLTTLESNEEGIISIDLPAGNYTVKLTVPEGYEATTTQYLLTANNPSREVVLTNIVLKEYTYVVHVQDRAGKPVAGVNVVIGDRFVVTKANGDASFVLVEGSYTVSIVEPDGYIADTTTYSFGEETSLTIVLARKDNMDSQAEYTVTVVDPDGKPFTDVMVRFEGEKGSPIVATVDANGTVTKKLDRDNYNVVLVFSGKTMDYEKCNAKLTLTDTSVVIQVAPVFKGQTMEIWPVIMDDSCTGHVVGMGGTYVNLTANGLTYFVFTPDQAGVYKITTTNPAALVENWNSTDFTSKMEFGVENNVFTLEVNGVGASYVIAVNAGENVNGTILKITREADVQTEPEVEIYQGTHTPNGKYVASVGEGQSIIFLSLNTEIVLVKDADGFYHLGAEDGPIVMVDLDATRYGINIAELVDRGAMLKYEYDADGKPIKRVDYTDCMVSYVLNRDENHGVYALTDDLITILQGHGENAGWYDVTSENYLFADSDVPADNAWMFLLCIAA